jgi:hypothetical protein
MNFGPQVAQAIASETLAGRKFQYLLSRGAKTSIGLALLVTSLGSKALKQ